METILENFDDLWSGGDPVTRQRFFLRTITPMIVSVTCYVLFVELIGPAIMKNRKPIQMRKLMTIYNFSLVIFYLYFLFRGAFFIPVLGFNFICGSLNENETPIIPEVFDLGYQLYFVRYIELLDTVFLVLSKKNNMITPLHVFHHAIVPVFGFFGFRSETSGYLAVFMALNSIVHIVMYTYYGIAAMGPEYQKYVWWKKYLTTFQITQFFLMTFYLLIMSSIGCITSKLTFAFSFFLTVLFFFLFIDYYRKIYNRGEKKSEKNGIYKNGTYKNGIPEAYKNETKKLE
uniref:Elongation of very long chain fatty acids protein n=1 Tax=Parasteatoda tepidariorum TaxID=114398 RepID=A0A2L2YJF1_PARTP